jgi:hypothetical protein
VMMLPLLASAGSQFHSPKFHYGGPILPFLLVATGAALARLPERLREPHAWMFLVSFTLLGFWLFGPPATDSLTKDAPDPAGARAALRLIKPGDGAAVGMSLGAHLAHRDQLLLYPYPFYYVKPLMPLTPKARRVDAETAATIDVVILAAPRDAQGQEILDAFTSSPYARDFRLQGRFADVLLYRRTGS